MDSILACAKLATARNPPHMLLLRSTSLPDGDGWIREIKYDGYKSILRRWFPEGLPAKRAFRKRSAGVAEKVTFTMTFRNSSQ